jgi:bifunctional ADP-heptose synthase (sugar kinase/adenylyltransferase)
MMAFDPEVIHRIPTEAQEVIDVSGAGDTVIAALVLGLLSGATLVEAARFANSCAGLVCQELGAVPVSLVKLRELWHE